MITERATRADRTVAASLATAQGLAREAVGRLAGLLFSGSDRSRTQRAAIQAFGVRVASAGIAYLSQVILARWMGSFEYGAYVFVWVWVLALGGLANLGFNISVMRFIAGYRESGELPLLRGLLLGSRVMVLASSTAVALLGLGVLLLLGDRIASHYLLPAYLALVCIPLYTLTDLQDGMGRARQWIGVGLLPPYVLRPLLLLVAMIAAHERGLPMTATTAAACAIFATWLTGLVQVVLLQRNLRRELPPGPRAYDIRLWLSTSLPILLITGFDLVVQNTDVLVISLYMTPRDVGVYYAGLKTMSLIAFVHYAVASATANRFAALEARGARDELIRFAQETVRWTFWPSLAGALAILLLGEPLLRMFGPEFTAAYGPMFILAMGLLVKASVGPAEFLLNMLGEQMRCGAVLLATAVLNIALNLALVPIWGLWGAAIATATTLTVASMLYAWLVRRRLGIRMGIWYRA